MDLVKLLPVHRYSIDIFSYSGPSGILGSDGRLNAAWCWWAWEFMHFVLVLMNRLNKIECGVILYCRFTVFLNDPFFQYSVPFVVLQSSR